MKKILLILFVFASFRSFAQNIHVSPMNGAGQMIYGGTGGTPTATATPAHAFMRPVWNGSQIVFTDTTAGGGSSTFAGLSDVSVSSPSSFQVPVYNNATSKWANKNLVPVMLGTIYNKSSWSSLTPDFIDASSGASVSGSTISFTGGTAGISSTKILMVHDTSLRYNVKNYAKITLGNLSSAYYISIGPNSVNSYVPISLKGSVSITTGGVATLSIDYYYGGWTSIATSPSTITCSSNDTLLLSFEKKGYLYTAQVIDKNTGGSLTISSMTGNVYATSPVTPNNTCQYAIWNGGNSFVLDSLSVTSTDNMYGIGFGGDSRAVGYGSGSIENSCYSILANKIPNLNFEGGGGDRVTELLARWPEIKSMHYPYYIISGYDANDFGSGQSLATVEANYTKIIDSLATNGTTPIILTPTYNSAANTPALISWMKSTWGSTYQVIDVFTATNFTGAFNADNIHPTAIGYAAEASKVLSTINIPLSSNSSDLLSNYIVNGTSQSIGNINLLGTTQSTNFIVSNGTAKEDVQLSAGNVLADYAQLQVYPSTTDANASSTLAIIPKGTGGLAGALSQFFLFGNDVTGGSANYAFGGMRFTGSQYVLGSGKSGTGTNYNLMFAASYLTDNATNANQFVLNTAGHALFNTGTDYSTARVQINNTGGAQLALHNGAAYGLLYVDPSAGFQITSVSSIGIPTAALPTGASTDSPLVVNNSSGTSTLKAIAPLPTLASGTYSSTVSAVTSITGGTGGVTISQFTYTQQGNVVHCMVSGSLTPAASSTTSNFTFSIPISATTTSQPYIGNGVFANNNGGQGNMSGGTSSMIASIVSGTTAEVGFYATTTISGNFSFSFDYKTN